MQHFYDGQIRRYITQTVRVLSNFVVKYGDGSLHRIPVMYGDADRQVASIIRNNSENKINSVPRISVYVSSLSLDRDRMSDQTFVSKVNVRERDVADGYYTQGQGRNYTVERLMPTPFLLKLKIDIWSANTDQKLQILEQILVLFNPSLELQTTDNYIDWTSLSVLNLTDIAWSSRQVPVGSQSAGDPIDVATLTVETPIWISPPVKVKHLGVITKIITSMYKTSTTSDSYIEGLGSDSVSPTTSFTDLISVTVTSIQNYHIAVYNSQAILLGKNENIVPKEPTLEIPVRQGTPVDWQELFDQYPGQYHAGSTQIYLTQPNGTQVVGTVAINSLDNSILQINWNPDTLVSDTGIDSAGLLEGTVGYTVPSYRNGTSNQGSPGTFDAIINPLTYNPKRPLGEDTDQTIRPGTRYLIIEDIGAEINDDGADGWKGTDSSELIALANDIIEWTGTTWNVIFNHTQNTDTLVWQTNIYTGVQYLWNGVQWVKSFEGEYDPGQWKIIL